MYTAMNTPAPRRSAREDVAAATQERLMAGVADLLRASSEVTYDTLAAQAGVPLRTLYRYYPSKEQLFASFWPWMNTRIDVPSRPETPAELVDHIPALFAAFDRDEPLIRAMLHHPQGRLARLDNAAGRREKFSAALHDITKDLSPVAAKRLLASVTALCSASGWETMKDNWGLSGPAAAEAARWAVTALIDGARGAR
jgi:AcrR family transcriptional regulator